MFIVAGGNPLPLPLNDSPENEATLDLIIGSQQHPHPKIPLVPLAPTSPSG